REDVVDADVGLEVVVRLAATVRPDRARMQRRRGLVRAVWEDRRTRRAGVGVVRGGVSRREAPGAEQLVCMARDLLRRERYRLDAARLGHDEAVALMERDPAAKVRQREG